MFNLESLFGIKIIYKYIKLERYIKIFKIIAFAYWLKYISF